MLLERKTRHGICLIGVWKSVISRDALCHVVWQHSSFSQAYFIKPTCLHIAYKEEGSDGECAACSVLAMSGF